LSPLLVELPVDRDLTLYAPVFEVVRNRVAEQARVALRLPELLGGRRKRCGFVVGRGTRHDVPERIDVLDAVLAAVLDTGWRRRLREMPRSCASAARHGSHAMR